MTKMQKRIVMYMAAILILLALVCTCLVGNTFARFTSSDTISGSANTAKWSISQDTSGVQTVNDAQLSPNMIEYGTYASGYSSIDEDTGNYTSVGSVYCRYKTSSEVLIAKLTNDSDVDAYVKFTQGDLAFADQNGDDFDNFDGTGYGWSNSAVTGSGASEDQVTACFAFNVVVRDDGGDLVNPEATGNYLGYYSLEIGAEYSIYVTLTWTSYDVDSATNNDGGAVADKIDEWIGTNIGSVSTTITYTAVQGSQIPASA